MCAGCELPIIDKEQRWAITGTGKTIHYGGSFADTCMKRLAVSA